MLRYLPHPWAVIALAQDGLQGGANEWPMRALNSLLPRARSCERTRRPPGTWADYPGALPDGGGAPGTHPRPDAFEGVGMHLAEPIPVIIPGVLARRMAVRDASSAHSGGARSMKDLHFR